MAKYIDMSADVTVEIPVSMLIGAPQQNPTADDAGENEEVKENGDN